MKKYSVLCLIALLASLSGGAQTTTTFIINANDEDATIDNYNPAGNYPNEIEYASRAWTISSVPTVWRSVFKFNLSCIPQNAVVQSASLSLYYATQNGFGNQQHESLTSSDESVVQRITSPWFENTVTWNNQPAATNADEVILPQSTAGTQDYTNMDVTAMVQQMVATVNYGFLLKLTTEVQYANMLFASGDNPVSSKHPMLVVTYTVPGISCITLRMDPNSEDATIDNYNPGGNYPNEIEYASRAWTISSIPTVWRSVFKFDFPCSLAGATIQSAALSLYYAVQNGFGNQQHESLTSSDESVVQRITSAWAENTVTWNNQPASTNVDEVILPQSTSGTQDYTNMNVTAMVQQMMSAGNNGFLLKLTNEIEYANMLFASGDNPDTSRRPKLEICFSIPSAVHEINSGDHFEIYPNPAEDVFTVKSKSFGQHQVLHIVNMLGENVHEEKLAGLPEQTIQFHVAPGFYFVSVCGDGETQMINKLVVQ
jgi:hypothetical protein